MLIRYSDSEQLSQLSILCNTGNGELFSNVASAVNRGLPEIESYQAVPIPALIVGGGPSLASTLESIRAMKQSGARVFALNNSAKYLAENGITPDAQIIIDSRAQNVAFLEQRWAGELLLASQCHPSLFDRAAELGYPVRIWHPVIDGIEEHIKKEKPLLVGGGLTVGLSGMCLVYTLGHRDLHLFGYDSCHAEVAPECTAECAEKHIPGYEVLHVGHLKGHAYPQPMNNSDEMTHVAVDGRVFNCSLTMAAQATSFQRVADMLAELDCEITVHGDGLIPHIAQRLMREVKILTAVYDLAVSPPTYDFLSFLVEAERARKEGGYTAIDIVFQPGPIGGFRHDNLPPSLEEREGMLYRVCVAACRLLPSVRNVVVLKDRAEIKDNVFPKDYKYDEPVNHYGARYFKNAEKCLTATAGAKAEVRKRFPTRYATITLRESQAWPDRNSNKEAWGKVEWALARMGLQTVVVPDTSDKDANVFSWDLDMRLALYEGAEMNLGVSNGPMAILYCSNAPYMVFKITAPNSPSASLEFLKGQGMEEGDQYGDNGTLFWCDDDADKIIDALKTWQQPEKIAV